MTKNDGVPDLIIINERSKRETLELCGDELEGLRCMLIKEHPGEHECLANKGTARWLSSRAS